MIKIILVGACGNMGCNLSSLVSKNENFEIVAGIDKNILNTSYPIYNDFSFLKEKADVIIDFSKPELIEKTLSFAVNANLPLVIAQTGLSEVDFLSIDKASLSIPIFVSANLAFNVLQFAQIVKNASKILYPNFEIEIVEKHHNQKIDAPSGTAKMLFDNLKEENTELVANYNRNNETEKRRRNEVGMHAIRGGSIVGEHQVHFIGSDEVITFTHSALSKNIFSQGALDASEFIIKQRPGLYKANNLLKVRNLND